MSVVMIGAFTVVTGTIESQNKLEKVISKGFTHLTYSGKGFPLHPPILTYVTRPGWFRVPSSHAINPTTKEISGTLVVRELNLMVSKTDIEVDTPTWNLCKSDESVRIKCGPFVNGQASVSIELNTVKIPPSAIFQLRAEWPSLPAGHPNKYSPQYTITIPFIQDCDLTSAAPNAPKFLEHGWQYRESSPPEIDGKCEPNWTNYICLNGVLTPKPFKKVCN